MLENCRSLKKGIARLFFYEMRPKVNQVIDFKDQNRLAYQYQDSSCKYFEISLKYLISIKVPVFQEWEITKTRIQILVHFCFTRNRHMKFQDPSLHFFVGGKNCVAEGGTSIHRINLLNFLPCKYGSV